MKAASYLREDLAGQMGSDDLLAWAEGVASQVQPGQVYRNKEGRITLRFEYQGKSFFLKLHRGIGWREVFKNLLQLRLPIISARNEYEAVHRLESLNIDTLAIVAYSLQGINPASTHSMLVTEELTGTVSLEDYCRDWAGSPPPASLKRRLINKLASSASGMHGGGINHRDFYLCHFHLDPDSLESRQLRCHLIDLHRAQLRESTPRRWRVKDLAGLYFSAMDCGLSRRDLLRFIHQYSDGGLRQALGIDKSLWQEVERGAVKLYRKEHGSDPPQPCIGG
ncbi:MAG: heptose I phosphotransferase [Alcanivorax sp.]|jgi:heptose I phosphotransferase